MQQLTLNLRRCDYVAIVTKTFSNKVIINHYLQELTFAIIHSLIGLDVKSKKNKLLKREYES